MKNQQSIRELLNAPCILPAAHCTATALLGAAHIKWMPAAADISQPIQLTLQNQALTARGQIALLSASPLVRMRA
jgi:hypothetical protein